MGLVTNSNQAATGAATGSSSLQPAFHRLLELHNTLFPRIRNHSLDLHTRWQKSNIVSYDSAATTTQEEAVALVYFRSREQASQVERLMGKDGAMINSVVETYRHPLIEVRLTPNHLAVELIVSPSAWYDQQNLAGKIAIPQYRVEFRKLLKKLGSGYHFGFWDGVELGDMQVEVTYLMHGQVLNEWLDTFAAGYDWLRIGRWTPADTLPQDDRHLANEIFDAVQHLYGLYEFIRWTGNNNYRGFYEKQQRQQV